MIRIIHILASLKIVPVQKGNYSQYNAWSLHSLVAFLIWFCIPALLVVLGEVNEALDKSGDSPGSLLMSAAGYFTTIRLGLILLAGPQLLGLLTRKCSSLLDMELLPMPKRQWMILLSTPLPAMGMLMGCINYAMTSAKNNSLFPKEVSLVLKFMPQTILAAMSSIVVSSMLMIMSSALTYMISRIKVLESFDDNVDLVWNTIDTYHDICIQLGPIFMLLFPTFCSAIMIETFYLYEYFNSPAAVFSSCTFILSGILIIVNVAFIANDCEDAILDLQVYFRQVTPNQITNTMTVYEN